MTLAGHHVDVMRKGLIEVTLLVVGVAGYSLFILGRRELRKTL